MISQLETEKTQILNIQILLTVILNQVIDTALQLPLICAYAENDLENFIIKVLEMQFNAFMLKNFSQYYA